MIYLLTGPVRSGKTTSLIEWSAKRNDVFGILTPDINGRRFFMDVQTKMQFPMEAVAGEEALTVGRFAFSKRNFEQAAEIILSAAGKDGWLVIDEAGPLELRGEGFAPVLKEVFKIRNSRIVVVVREGLAEQMENFFGLGTNEINLINNIYLSQLI